MMEQQASPPPMWAVHRLTPFVLILALAAAACADSGPLPPTGGEPVDAAILISQGVSYRAVAERPLASLSSSDMDELGRGEAQEGMVDVFQLRSGGKEWEVVTRSGDHWIIWEPAAVGEARRDLGQRLSVPEDQVSAKEAARVEWPDACLGAAGSDEICAEVITPGFLIVLEAEGREYFYRGDLLGNVRRAP